MKLIELAKKSDVLLTIELRLDFSRENNLELITCLKEKPNNFPPLILTCRKKTGNHLSRIHLLKEIFLQTHHQIDIEYESLSFFQEELKKSPQRFIISHHYAENPSRAELSSLISQLKRHYPHSLKKIVLPYNSFFPLSFYEEENLLFFSGGEKGILSRFTSLLYGQLKTMYCCYNKKHQMDKGQMTTFELLHIYQIQRLKKDFSLYGVIGNPIGHSKSPHVFNPLWAQEKKRRFYLPLFLQHLKGLEEIKEKSFFPLKGISITLPFKEDILNEKTKEDFIHQSVEKTRSCNTLIFKENNKKFFYNTDYLALKEILPDLANLSKKTALVLGASGVGRAIIEALLEKDYQIYLYNRTYEKAKQIAFEISSHKLTVVKDEKKLDHLMKNFQLIANATSVGMTPLTQQSPLKQELMTKTPADCLFFDIVYNPKETLFLQWAAELKRPTLQSEEAFFLQAQKQKQLFDLI